MMDSNDDNANQEMQVLTHSPNAELEEDDDNSSSASSSPVIIRNPYRRKWRHLFAYRNEEWISFQPKLGSIAFVCYACKHLFHHRSLFLSHVNLTYGVFKYKCRECDKELLFYNSCMFLMHCRMHFSEQGGSVDLDDIEIVENSHNLPGWRPTTNVPRLQDVTDEPHDGYLCVKFYQPSEECVNKRIVLFTSFDFVFFHNEDETSFVIDKDTQAMILKQVSKNIPKCVFVPLNVVTKYESFLKILSFNRVVSAATAHINSSNSSAANDPGSTSSQTNNEVIILDSDDEASSEGDDDADESNVPNLSSSAKGETSTSSVSNYKPFCPECERPLTTSLKAHFQEIRTRLDDEVKCETCGFLSPNVCSLKAHVRTHEKREPYICPECGAEASDWIRLFAHMHTECFHEAKTIRYKCPVRTCGRVYGESVPFTSHFKLAHMKAFLVCDVCPGYFENETELADHTKSHESIPCTYQKIHECIICSTLVSNIKEHVLTHVLDTYKRIYSYKCKYCRTYHRTCRTYAAHLQRCIKRPTTKQMRELNEHNGGDKYCKTCNSKSQCACIYTELRNVPNTSGGEHIDSAFVRKDVNTNNFICILCNNVLKEGELNNYGKHKCKYRKLFSRGSEVSCKRPSRSASASATSVSNSTAPGDFIPGEANNSSVSMPDGASSSKRHCS